MLIKSKKITYIKDRDRKSGGFIPSEFVAGGDKKKRGKKAENVAVPASHQAESERKIQAAAREAYDQGFAEGMLRGGEVEKKRLSSAVSCFEKAMLELAGLRQDIFVRLEPEILDLAISIAEKVIHEEVHANKNVCMGVLKEAVRHILDREGMKIRLNPRDHDHMLEANPSILNSFEGVKNPVFEKDDTLSPGDVVIETLFGEIDARLDKQLDQIKAALSREG